MMVEYRRFGGKKMEKKEGGKTNTYGGLPS